MHKHCKKSSFFLREISHLFFYSGYTYLGNRRFKRFFYISLGLCFTYFFSRFQGDRLSHAVGCAFAICLEKKQKRDKECAVTMNFDNSSSSFTRIGSFRQATITERLADPQVSVTSSMIDLNINRANIGIESLRTSFHTHHAPNFFPKVGVFLESTVQFWTFNYKTKCMAYLTKLFDYE